MESLEARRLLATDVVIGLTGNVETYAETFSPGVITFTPTVSAPVTTQIGVDAIQNQLGVGNSVVIETDGPAGSTAAGNISVNSSIQNLGGSPVNLRFNAGGSIIVDPGSGPVSNTLAGMSVTFNGDLEIGTGTTTGLFSITGDVNFASASSISLDVNGSTPGTGADQLSVTGAVDITNTRLVLSGTIGSAPGQTVVLIDNDAADAVIGTFGGLAEGAIVPINGIDFALSYVGGDGNDVVLTEPIPATIVVTTAMDENDGTIDPGTGAGTSLREAIIAANADPGLTTITFDPLLNGTPIGLTIGGTDEDSGLTGDLDITTEIVIQGNGPTNTLIDGGVRFDIATGTVTTPGFGDRVWDVRTGGNLSLDQLTVTGGQAAGVLPDNDGGGVRAASESTLAITRSTLSGNTATGEGGGVSNGGTTTIMDSTLSGNTATGSGGAVSSYGAATMLAITGSTLSGNAATGDGGGVDNGGTATITGSTLSGNTAGFSGGGVNNFGTATINNTIIANSVSGGDLSGTFSGTDNLVEDGSGTGLLNTVTGDPLLGPLQDNGGPTFTHALLTGSPAIDAGDDTASINAGITTDQRGENRFVGTVDIGAFEVQPAMTTFVVTTAIDENDGTTDPGTGAGTSLREAIIAANANSDLTTITFDPSLNGTPIGLSIGGTGEDSGATGDLDITTEIVIQGNGPTNTLIDGGVRFDLNGTITTPGFGDRVLDVLTGGNLSLDQLSVAGGQTNFGGGVRAASGSTLAITDSIVSGNTVTVDGGGIFVDEGSLSVVNSTISDNIAGDSGGGVYADGATLTITGSTISGNQANGVDSGGGGVYLLGSGLTNPAFSIVNTDFRSNTANSGGGGLEIVDAPGIITGGLYELNRVVAGALNAEGGGAIVILASQSTTSPPVSISGITVRNNSAPAGGGLAAVNPNLELDSVLIENNSTINLGGAFATTSSGGGIAAISDGLGGRVTITNSTILNNTAISDAAGIASIDVDISLIDTTISGNSAGGVAANGRGGGIGMVGVMRTPVLTANRVTIDNNTSTDIGGGVGLINAGLDFTNVTVTDNESTGTNGGGLVYSNTDSTVLRRIAFSTFASNTGTNILATGAPIDMLANVLADGAVIVDVGFSFNSLGHNIYSSATLPGLDDPTDVNSTNVNLLGLADFGGPVFTRPSIDSVTLDRVPVGQSIAVDARGIPRIGTTSNLGDVGAVESFQVDMTTINVNEADGAQQTSFQLDRQLPFGVTLTSGPLSTATVTAVSQTFTFLANDSFTPQDLLFNLIDDNLVEADFLQNIPFRAEVNPGIGIPLVLQDAPLAFIADDDATVITAADASRTINEDSSQSSVVLSSLVTNATETVTYALVSTTSGTASVVGETLFFTPAAHFFGQATLVYLAADSSGSDQGTVVFTVLPVNDPPIASDDAFTVAFNANNTPLNVLANDVAGPGETEVISVSSVGAATNGIASLNPSSGLVTYTPNVGFSGSDSFNYTMIDDGGLTSTATVLINVTAANVSLTGTVSCDVNSNGSNDPGEETPDAMVFLDLNRNGLFDENEPMTLTDSQGNYSFSNLDGARAQVVLMIPGGCGLPTEFAEVPLDLNLGDLVRDIVVVDVDGDGRDDLIAVNEGDGKLVRYRPAILGSSSEEISIPGRPQAIDVWTASPDPSNPSSQPKVHVAVAATGDGLTTPINGISRPGRGAIYAIDGLTSTELPPMGDGPIDVLVDDFDGDNLPDYVSAAFRSDEFWIRLSTQSVPTLLASGDMPVQVESGFFDDDAFLDLALGSRGYGTESGTVQIMFGTGSGAFTEGPVLQSAGKLAGLASADLRTSGTVLQDELITLDERGQLRVFAVNSSSLNELESIALDAATSKIRVGDIDGDSNADVVVVRPGEGEVDLLLGNGSGGLIRGKLSQSASSVVDVAFGDLDGSGRDSLIVASLFRPSGSGSGNGSTNLFRLGVDKRELSIIPGATAQAHFSPSTLEARMDVNSDGMITSLDALRVINEINAGSTNPPTSEPLDGTAVLLDLGSPSDVNGDGQTTALDALMVINHLNARESTLTASGESIPDEWLPARGEDVFLSPEEDRLKNESIDAVMAESGGLF